MIRTAEYVAGQRRQPDVAQTILAVSARNYAVVAADTRQSTGYNIQSRYEPRCHPLTDDVVIAVQGFMGDANTLRSEEHT